MDLIDTGIGGRTLLDAIHDVGVRSCAEARALDLLLEVSNEREKILNLIGGQKLL